MSMMKTDNVREAFLDFFRAKGHSIVSSDSLVPQNDPSLLFTGAGMNQFKEYFLGVKKDLKRAASSQKCLRTGDLDEVGRTAFHHSFFEMLGNFSFGDYFKEAAISWAWEFLTQSMKIPPERLRISVHQKDDEAFKIWRDRIKIRESWIYKLGDKGNFWPANAPADGPNGPCGPCSEIYFDQDPSQGPGGTVEDSRFAEIWNLVFTQYDRQDGGKLVPLAQKNIDTGMGLERLTCVLQGQKTNYEIDIFQPINQKIENLLLGLGGKVMGPNRSHLYAISDHLRAVTFCIADGVIPGNDGRGYVIRKLIRRALWRAHQIKPMQELDPFLHSVVATVAEVMAKPYPEVREAQASIASTLKGEEERFLDTFETGCRLLESRLANIKGKSLPGEIVFELYDTYGFPDELTKVIAQDKGFQIDQKGFDKLMADQRKRAKDASKISDNIFATTDLEKKVQEVPATEFLGYSAMEAEGKVLWSDTKDGQGIVILDKTPCYGEGGGQVGDQGTMTNGSFTASITDTQKKDNRILHYVQIQKGSLKAGDKVKVAVDADRRARTMRNHTATHLLHAALRKILGNQVRQLGSLVAPEKLRFDYSHGQPLTADEVRKIENDVNAQIFLDIALTKEEKPIDEAKKDGAIAFFGEKYGAKVRVVSVPGYSKEFCGGTHCERTGQIGFFVIVGDSSIASGTRRIEALTGEGALEYVRTLRSQVRDVAQALKTTPDKLVERVGKLQESVKKLEKGIGSASQTEAEFAEEKQIGNYKFMVKTFKNLDLDGLRKQSDDLRSKTNKTIYFLGAENTDKIHFVLGVSHDMAKSSLNMRDLGQSVSSILDGNSGGRPDLVQGGAPNRRQLTEKISTIFAEATTYLTGKN